MPLAHILHLVRCQPWQCRSPHLLLCSVSSGFVLLIGVCVESCGDWWMKFDSLYIYTERLQLKSVTGVDQRQHSHVLVVATPLATLAQIYSS
jgi:hypothetical protein